MSPPGKSIVWNFFEKTLDKKFVVCKLCRQKMKYFASTSNLRQHIIRKHNSQYHEHMRKDNSNEITESTCVAESVDLTTAESPIEYTNIFHTDPLSLAPPEGHLEYRIIYESDSVSVVPESAVDVTMMESSPESKDIPKSMVWLFFEKTSDKKCVMCKLCRQILKYYLNTNNLKQHILWKHNNEYHEYITQHNPNETDFIASESAVDITMPESHIKSRRYEKSIVWSFFDKTADKKFAVCKLCRKRLKYFISTTNLMQHIIRKHNNEYYQHRGKGNPNETDSSFVAAQTTLGATMIESHIESRNGPSGNQHHIESPESSLKITSKSTSTADIKRPFQLFSAKESRELSEVVKKQCDLSLLKLIVKDFQPLCIVENTGFLEYSAALNPLYKVPSRYVLTNNLLLEQYLKEVAKLKSVLCEVKYVSLTTDIWQSDSNVSYLSITCHFIHNHRLNSRVLSTKEITSEHHTGENIATDILSVIAEWDIDEKIVTIVSHNGDNIKNAVVEHLQKCHHPCMADTLNLIVKECLTENDQFGDLITKCKYLVAYFKHSGHGTENLRKCQQEMGLPCLKIKQAVETRWNSTVMMLERLLDVKDPLSAVITSLPSAPEFLDMSEWNIISDCVPIFKPLELMGAELSGEKCTTMSTIIPLMRGLQVNIRNMTPTTEIGLWLQSKLIEMVTEHLALLETDNVVAKSTFLDPRLKKTAFGLGENARNAQAWITEEIIALISNAPVNKSDGIGSSEQESSPDVDITTNTMSLWSHFDQKIKEVSTKTTPATSAILTVRQYLELPHCSRTSDPLEFWENHRLMMPELYELHLKYAGIPATSAVLSEVLFSKAGQAANLRRNKISSKHVDAILFLNGCL